MNGAPRFIVYGVAAEQWATRYGLEAFSYPCSECGRMCTTSIPFAQGTLRGLQSPRCECGNEKTPFAMVRDSKHGDLFTGIETEGGEAQRPALMTFPAHHRDDAPIPWWLFWALAIGLLCVAAYFGGR